MFINMPDALGWVFVFGTNELKFLHHILMCRISVILEYILSWTNWVQFSLCREFNIGLGHNLCLDAFGCQDLNSLKRVDYLAALTTLLCRVELHL